MRQSWETAATATLVLCAATVTTLAIRREIKSNRAAASPRAVLTRQVDGWQTFERIGHRIGPSTARATITEFVDYECPACRHFSSELAEVLEEMDKKHPGQVATVFVHYPLPAHRFAKVSGQAVECADAQTRFRQMQAVLFAKQDSLGLKPWAAYAREAGVNDSLRFARCLADSSSARKVLQGLELADKLDLPATPTIMLNGWQYFGVPSRDQLQAAIERVLRGERPADASPTAAVVNAK